MASSLQPDLEGLTALRRWGAGLTVVGGLSVIGALWMVFFYVPTESTMGIMQRMYYIHIPTAWLGMLAFGLMALCSLVFLWLKDDRLDAIAISAAEIGFIFLTATLVVIGPLWARLAWGAWWVWDARLSFTLLLWLIWIGYFVLRNSTENPERGKRLAGVLAIVGSVDLPIIHVSVNYFRTQHPPAVILNPTGPTADFEIGITIGVSVLAFTLVFFGLLFYRYGFERLKRQVDVIRYARRNADYSSPIG